MEALLGLLDLFGEPLLELVSWCADEEDAHRNELPLFLMAIVGVGGSLLVIWLI